MSHKIIESRTYGQIDATPKALGEFRQKIHIANEYLVNPNDDLLYQLDLPIAESQNLNQQHVRAVLKESKRVVANLKKLLS